MLHVRIVDQSVLAVTSTSPIESLNRINIGQVYAIFALLIRLVSILILHTLVVVFLPIAVIIVFIIILPASAVPLVEVPLVQQVLLVENAPARLLVEVARQARSWHHPMRDHLGRGVELVIRLCLLDKTCRWR